MAARVGAHAAPPATPARYTRVVVVANSCAIGSCSALLGDQPPPSYPILAVRLADLHEKEAVLAAGHRGFSGFSSPLVT